MLSKTTMTRACGAFAAVLLSASGAAAQDGPPGSLPPLPADAPPPPAGPRNLEGAWMNLQRFTPQILEDNDGQPVPLNAEGRRVLDSRLTSLKDGTPFINASAICRPPAPPWQLDLNFPFEMHHLADRVEFIFEEFHGAWTIFLDPAKAPKEPSYMGVSTGRWEGDALVVETSRFRQPFWLDVNGTPASAEARLTQKFRKVNDGRWYLEVINTIDDPKYYTRPWSWTRMYDWRPDQAIFKEYNCEEQVGDPNYLAQSGLVPEPQ